ncbi:MAG: hypothetical protein HPY75_05790 [Actinobacteria bacterium]|nr:hypothetical protein [Actinomycetota bacterium]
MRIRKCAACGFPHWLAKIMRWHGNGTISWTLAPEGRLVLIKSDLLNSVFSRLESEMGLPIGHIVFEAQRNAVAAGIGALFDRFPASLGRLGPNKRLVIRFFCRLSIWLGTAYVEYIMYRPGKEGEALLRNPYNRDLMAALILGAFEGLERRPFEHSWRSGRGDDVIRVVASTTKPEVSERLTVAPTHCLEGGHSLARCPRCGVPRDLASLEWREGEGIVIDTDKGIRVSFVDAFTPGIVFRELEKELGSEVNGLIVEASKDFFAKQVMGEVPGGSSSGPTSGDDLADAFRDSLSFLPSYGQGLVTDITHQDGGLEIVVINPYDVRLIAGYLGALREKITGAGAKVEWEERDATRVTYRLA